MHSEAVEKIPSRAVRQANLLERRAAHYLVKGNLKHFPAKWADTLTGTPHQFFEAPVEIRDEPPEM